MVGCLQCSVLLPLIPQCVGIARHAVRAALVDNEHREAAELVASELTSNSVRYARSFTDDPDARYLTHRFAMEVRVAPQTGAVLIQVSELAGSSIPEMRKPTDDEEGGRGLYNIDQITGGKWGWKDDGAIRKFWALVG